MVNLTEAQAKAIVEYAQDLSGDDPLYEAGFMIGLIQGVQGGHMWIERQLDEVQTRGLFDGFLSGRNYATPVPEGEEDD